MNMLLVVRKSDESSEVLSFPCSLIDYGCTMSVYGALPSRRLGNAPYTVVD